jgi:hypothetical protein
MVRIVETQEPFITDSFFSRLKWEVQFQTQKFDAKLHALQSKGKGKTNVTEARCCHLSLPLLWMSTTLYPAMPAHPGHRPKHTFGPIEELKGAAMTPNGLPEPQLTRLPTGDIMYTLHMPIGTHACSSASSLRMRPVRPPMED